MATNRFSQYRKRTKFLWIFALVLVVAAGIFWPLPYYLQLPGQALALSGVVQVGEETHRDEKPASEMMMTTVNMLRANPLFSLFAWMSPHADFIPLERVRVEGESSKEYTMRQLAAMKESQENAMIAAFREAGLPIEVRGMGVQVLDLVEGMPAAQQLKVGDILTHVNGQPVSDSEKLLRDLARREAGEEVKLEGTREGEAFEVRLQMDWLPVAEGESSARPGIGILPGSLREVLPSVPVNFDTRKIGGPSAGLMFALEILDQLLPADLAEGLRVAGTGTMDAEGRVGQIGGVTYKVAAADQADADIFLVPEDRLARDNNARLAQEAAERIGTSMQVVPVGDLSEAVAYLQQPAD